MIEVSRDYLENVLDKLQRLSGMSMHLPAGTADIITRTKLYIDEMNREDMRRSEHYDQYGPMGER